MTVKSIQSGEIYLKIMNAPLEKKNDIFRYELMKPFQGKWDCYHIPLKAPTENGYDIVMYGHTHVPFLDVGDKVTILNPGSISYPRQDGRKHTFMMIDVDSKGEFHYNIATLKSSLRDYYEGFF